MHNLPHKQEQRLKVLQTVLGKIESSQHYVTLMGNLKKLWSFPHNYLLVKFHNQIYHPTQSVSQFFRSINIDQDLYLKENLPLKDIINKTYPGTYLNEGYKKFILSGRLSFFSESRVQCRIKQALVHSSSMQQDQDHLKRFIEFATLLYHHDLGDLPDPLWNQLYTSPIACICALPFLKMHTNLETNNFANNLESFILNHQGYISEIHDLIDKLNKSISQLREHIHSNQLNAQESFKFIQERDIDRWWIDLIRPILTEASFAGNSSAENELEEIKKTFYHRLTMICTPPANNALTILYPWTEGEPKVSLFSFNNTKIFILSLAS